MHLSAPAHPDLIEPTPAPGVSAVRLRLGADVPLYDVQDTLELARLGAVSLYGPERTSLEAHADLDPQTSTVTIDTTTAVGRTLAILFLGYARRQYGEHAVQVIRGEGVVR